MKREPHIHTPEQDNIGDSGLMMIRPCELCGAFPNSLRSREHPNARTITHVIGCPNMYGYYNEQRRQQEIDRWLRQRAINKWEDERQPIRRWLRRLVRRLL